MSLTRDQKYYQKNKEKIKARSVARYERTREKAQEAMRKYYHRTQPLKPVVLCGCGCGEKAMPGRKYIKGHFNRGRKFSDEFCRNVSKAKRNMTEETKRKMSKSAKGKVLSFETRRKISEAFTGHKHPAWRGGISHHPYGCDWTKELKQLIKDRDNHNCQNPGCWGTSRELDVHHIDYGKKNCRLDNLITLCVSCNARANHNRRMWQEFYQGIVDDILTKWRAA
ncbi:hypothetical protein LCGC14_0612870 [marine sediment metagenome]|uniref:HNH nuclease domain-containing protein n=1 Tax=marine sediment metagenome TaxID=412755 RepID=A0A0F9UFR1_9ZZZZ